MGKEPAATKQPQEINQWDISAEPWGWNQHPWASTNNSDAKLKKMHGPQSRRINQTRWQIGIARFFQPVKLLAGEVNPSSKTGSWLYWTLFMKIARWQFGACENAAPEDFRWNSWNSHMDQKRRRPPSKKKRATAKSATCPKPRTIFIAKANQRSMLQWAAIAQNSEAGWSYLVAMNKVGFEGFPPTNLYTPRCEVGKLSSVYAPLFRLCQTCVMRGEWIMR